MELMCHGCKTDTLFIICRHCKIRKCAIERKIEHCNDCGDYPCTLFNQTLLNPMVQQMLPHLKGAPENLMALKNIGVKQWLVEQKKKWKCPDCQTEFSWYMVNCQKCSRDLEEVKDYNQME